MQPIQLRFSYTEAEYLNASRLLLMREGKMIVRLVAFFILLLSGGILLTMLVPEFTFPFWLVLLIVLMFVGVFVHKIFADMPRKYFRGDAKMRDEFVLTFSHDGVWVKTSQIDSKMAWSLYTRVFENSSIYVIVYGKDARMMTAVPKRVFRSAQEEVEFRNLLRQHVDDRLPLTNPSIDDRIPEYVPSRSEPPDWR
jgi:hypothetical protein